MYNNLLNMFINIQNGQIARRSFILQRRKNLCEVFLKILWKENFILGYKIFNKNPQTIQIFLKYKNNKSILNNIKIISKQNRRVFYSKNEIWRIKNNNSLVLFFTSNGVKSITECKQHKIGGEPIILVN